MTDRRVLVVGTYPPIPRPAATATVEAVRRAWANGDVVTVASPRPSAAHQVVRAAGPAAGPRLDRLRRLTSAQGLVVVFEPGFPVPATGRWRFAMWCIEWLTVRGLIAAFGRFEQVTMVEVGTLAISLERLVELRRAADEVLAYPGDALTPGVTALGPPETRPAEIPRQILGSTARRILGSYAGPVRARAMSILRR
jgi:hypothetical protein